MSLLNDIKIYCIVIFNHTSRVSTFSPICSQIEGKETVTSQAELPSPDLS